MSDNPDTTKADNDPETIRAMREIAKRAGVLPHEMSEHPEYGLLISATGVQKIRNLAPPSHASAQLGQQASRSARAAIKAVK